MLLMASVAGMIFQPQPQLQEAYRDRRHLGVPYHTIQRTQKLRMTVYEKS